MRISVFLIGKTCMTHIITNSDLKIPKIHFRVDYTIFREYFLLFTH